MNYEVEIVTYNYGSSIVYENNISPFLMCISNFSFPKC